MGEFFVLAMRPGVMVLIAGSVASFSNVLIRFLR